MLHSQPLRRTFIFLSLAPLLGSCGGGANQSAGSPPCAAATKTCFVRASGQDGNTGADPANALKTISRAAVLALDGYTIIVGPGIYHEGVTTTSVGAAPNGLQFIADPTGAQTNDAKGAVIIDATGTSQNAGFKLFSSGCVTLPGGAVRCGLIDGFEITGGADAGILIKSGSDQFAVQNCIVHDNPGDGIRIQDSPAVLIFNNLVYDNGLCNPGCNGTGIAIVGTISGSPNAQIYNNTIFGSKNHGLTIGTTAASSPGATVFNNIVQDNDASSAPIGLKVVTNHPSASNDSLKGFHGNCNLVFPATYDPTSLKNSHDLNTDALFVNPPTDFHLQSTSPVSPAIDASVAQDCPLLLPNSEALILKQRTTTGTNAHAGPPDGGSLDLGFHFLRN